MVHLVPSISFLKRLIMEIESGNAVSMAMKKLLESEKSEFAVRASTFFNQWRSGNHPNVDGTTQNEAYMFELIRSGLEGAPVLEAFHQLNREMEEEFERQWKLYLEALPFKLSLPLLFFFFPAYVVLLFGPLLTQFLMEVAR